MKGFYFSLLLFLPTPQLRGLVKTSPLTTSLALWPYSLFSSSQKVDQIGLEKAMLSLPSQSINPKLTTSGPVVFGKKEEGKSMLRHSARPLPTVLVWL